MKTIKRAGVLALAIIGLTFGGAAGAATFSYSGLVFGGGCSPTCDSFAALADGTQITGSIDISDAAIAGGAFSDADITGFSFAVTNPALPGSGPGNPVTDNPLFLIAGTGVVASNGSNGTTDGVNLLTGSILFEFLVAPFSSNGAFVLIDIATGDGAVCLFYSALGCPAGPGELPVSTQALSFTGNPGFTSAVVPVPAAVWLFGSALLGLFGANRRKTA